MLDDSGIVHRQYMARIAAGGKVDTIVGMPSELCQLLKSTIVTQWNCEYWGGRNYLDCISLAPSLAERKAVCAIGEEELGHGFILESGPLKALGVNPWEQKARTLLEQTSILGIFKKTERFTTWAHFLMFNDLQDRAAAIQLAEFREGPFRPWNDAIRKIEAEEDGHIQHGENGIRRLAGSKAGRRELQQALDDWLPQVLAVFGASDDVSKALPVYRRYGLKKSNDALRELFKAQIKPLLAEGGLVQRLLGDKNTKEDIVPQRREEKVVCINCGREIQTGILERLNSGKKRIHFACPVSPAGYHKEDSLESA